MINLDSVFRKQRHYFANKVPSRQGYGFPVVMYGCESWTIKKAECWRMNTFELWCWGRLLKVSWTARRSNQSILKEINSECSLEGLMLKLKLQYFGHLMQRADSFGKTLMLGKIEGRRRRRQQRMRWLDGITETLGVGDGQRGLPCCGRWEHKELDTAEWLNWTEWSSGFPYLLQSKSEFGNNKFMIWATFSSHSCFADCIELLHLWLQRIKSIWFWCWPSGDVHV